MSEVKRYDLHRPKLSECMMFEHPDGDWIKYHDHIAIVMKLERKPEEIEMHLSMEERINRDFS